LRKKQSGYYLFEDGSPLPEYKFIISQHNPTYTNPYGEKLLSKVYWPVTLKLATRDFWQRMIEKYGMPYLVSYYGPGATDGEKQNLLNEIEDIIENQGGLLPTDTPLDFKENPKYEIGQIYKNIIDFYNDEISKAILTETLTIDVAKSGSYKIADIHREMLEFIGVSDKKIVELALNKVLMYWYELNYGFNQADVPNLKLKKKEKVIETTVGRDKMLKDMGVEFTKAYYKKRYNLTDEDFKLKSKEEIVNGES
jgi:phage gp29-like protein